MLQNKHWDIFIKNDKFLLHTEEIILNYSHFEKKKNFFCNLFEILYIFSDSMYMMNLL